MNEAELKIIADSDHVYWQEQNEAWQKSEMSQKKFCKLNNLSYSKFTTWRSKLKVTTPGTVPKKLIPITVTHSPEFPSNPIRLRMPNGISLEFSSSLPMPQLQCLFKSLGIIK
jgi:hypothetical protein